MVLRAGYLQLAIRMQEAASDLSARDIQTRLSDAINDLYRGTGTWAYYIDHIGDGESGDVIYSHDSDTCKAPYSCTDVGGAVKCVIDDAAKVSVCPRTIYEEEADEDGHYAAMEAALKAEKLYGELPLYERFISKGERDKASGDDFAGKGKSFPILRPEDVSAAARSIGRAGSGNLGPSGIKARIIAIAKRKGWEKYLPKAWRDTKASEADVSRETSGNLRLLESFTFGEAEALQLVESAESTRREIKIIAPGKGSSAFYPAEVLKRDGPGVFKKGTQIYINHATAAEEAARPEGDWHKLAGALDGPAYWKESGKHGAGLYGMAAFDPTLAPSIIAKAPWSGMSIRANGDSVMEAGRPVLQEGVPILARLTSAESVDVVTRAGAGGMILTEAARSAESQEEVSMDAAEVKALREGLAAQAETNKKLLERAIRGDAREEAVRLLKTITLHEASKERIIDLVLAQDLPMTVTGELDKVKFAEALSAQAKIEGAYVATLTGAGRVLGMGSGVTETDPVKAREAEQRRTDEAKQFSEAAESVFTRLTGSASAGKAAAHKGVAA